MQTASHPSVHAARRSFIAQASEAEAAFFSAETRPSLLTWHRENACERICHLMSSGEISHDEGKRRLRAIAEHRPPQGWV